MKRLLWIMGVIAIALSIGACSNAVDSVKAVEEPDNPDNPDNPVEPVDGLNLATLNSLEDIVFSRRKNISVKLGLAGATSFSIKSGGSLPSGLSMDSDGLITGTANAVPTDATASFTVVADTGTETPLTWKVKAEQTQRITTYIREWRAPNAGYSTDNTTTLQVVAIGGGGGGGGTIQGTYGGGGGAGQFKEQAIQVTPGEVIAITPGGGGAGAVGGNTGGMGGTTIFGSYLTALGGGPGRGRNGTPPSLEVGQHHGGGIGGQEGGAGWGAAGASNMIPGKISSFDYGGIKIAGSAGGPGGRDVMNYKPEPIYKGSYIANKAPIAGVNGLGGGGAGGPVGISAPGANGSVYVNY